MISDIVTLQIEVVSSVEPFKQSEMQISDSEKWFIGGSY